MRKYEILTYHTRNSNLLSDRKNTGSSGVNVRLYIINLRLYILDPVFLICDYKSIFSPSINISLVYRFPTHIFYVFYLISFFYLNP